MFLTIVYITTCLAAACHVIDYMIGEKGDSYIRTFLTDGDELTVRRTRSLPHIAAQATGSYFDNALGEKLVSLKSIIVGLVSSAVITGLIMVVAAMNGSLSHAFQESTDDLWMIFAVRVTIVMMGVFLGSFPSLVATRVLLRWTVGADSARAVRYILLQIAMAYVSVVVAMNFTFSTTALAAGVLVGYFSDIRGIEDLLAALHELGDAWFNFLLAYTFEMFSSPWEAGRRLSFGETNLLFYAFPAALPNLIYIVAVGFAWVIDVLAVRRPDALQDIVKRIANDRRHVLASVSAMLGALVGFAKEAPPARADDARKPSGRNP